MKIIANRQLRGEYGLLVPGKQYEVKAHIATSLVRRGLASEPSEPEKTPVSSEPDPEPESEPVPVPKKRK